MNTLGHLPCVGNYNIHIQFVAVGSCCQRNIFSSLDFLSLIYSLTYLVLILRKPQIIIQGVYFNPSSLAKALIRFHPLPRGEEGIGSEPWLAKMGKSTCIRLASEDDFYAWLAKMTFTSVHIPEALCKR